MQGLNLSKFKKIGSDKNCTTLKHDDGHELKIAHGNVSSKMREQLEKLPVHKAHGGKLEQYEDNEKYPENASDQDHEEWLKKASENRENNHKKFMDNHKKSMHPTHIKKYAEGSEDAPVSKEDDAPEETQKPEAPAATPQGVNIYVNGNGAQPAPIQAPPPQAQQGAPQAPQGASPQPASEPPNAPEAEVLPEKAQGLAPAGQAPQAQDPQAAEYQASDFKAPQTIDQSVQQPSPMQAMAQSYTQKVADNKQELVQEDDKFMQDLVNGHIAPKTYKDLYAEKSTLGKIGTLFGMLVGGAGSGLAHQPNLLMHMMDQQINNDLQAQIQSKNNAQNFLRINQADLSNKVNAVGGVESAKTAALARTQAQMYQTSYHNLINMVNNLPAPQQAKWRAALQAMYPQLKDKINNIQDQASAAMAAQGVNPFDQKNQGSNKAAPQDGSSQKPSGGSQGKPSASGDHLLKPGSVESFKSAQYKPEYNDDKGQVREQIERASLADKAIDAINKHFPEMYANIKNVPHESDPQGLSQDEIKSAGLAGKVYDTLSDASGYVNRQAQDLGGIPYVGSAIAGLGNAVTNNQKNRDYNVHRAAVTPALQAVLTKSGMTPTEAEHALDTLLPELGDTQTMAKNKLRAAIEKIKQATPTDALERHGLMNKGK